MLKNFTRPEGEEVYYYSSTVENGEVIRHDGDPDHAVYKSEIEEQQRRASLWHEWLEENQEDAYGPWGVVKEDVFTKHSEVNRQFMDGEREK